MPSYSIHHDGDDRNLLDLYLEAVLAKSSKPPVANISYWTTLETASPDVEVAADFTVHTAKDGVLEVSPFDPDFIGTPTRPSQVIGTSRITEIRFY